jgi:hypothetical protein
MDKVRVIKKADREAKKKVHQSEYQIRMEQSLLTLLAHKHPEKAKEIVQQLPLAVV